MTTYSTQFFRGPVPAGVLGTLYTVPANDVVVLRDIELFIGGTADLFNLQIGVPGNTEIVWYLNSPPASSWHQWTGRTVVKGGESIFAFATNANDQIVVSGYLLTGP